MFSTLFMTSFSTKRAGGSMLARGLRTLLEVVGATLADISAAWQKILVVLFKALVEFHTEDQMGSHTGVWAG